MGGGVYAPGKIKYVGKYDGDAHARATRTLPPSVSLSLSLSLSLLPSLAPPQPSRVDAFGNFNVRVKRVAREITEPVQPHREGVEGENFSRRIRPCTLFAGFARRDRPGENWDSRERSLVSAHVKFSLLDSRRVCKMRGRDCSAKLHQVELRGPITWRAILHVRR